MKLLIMIMIMMIDHQSSYSSYNILDYSYIYTTDSDRDFNDNTLAKGTLVIERLIVPSISLSFPGERDIHYLWIQD